METILIATRNAGKAAEFKEMFEPRGYIIQTLHDYPDLADIVEDGTTFDENARKKAESISQIVNQLVIGDDSGLAVDALDGAPGIYSARYAGPDADDTANNKKLLDALSSIDWDQRTASFHTSLAVAAPNKETLVVHGQVDGFILDQAQGQHGFGYDPLFYYPPLKKSFGQLPAHEKNKISHRAKALEQLDSVWDEWLGREG